MVSGAVDSSNLISVNSEMSGNISAERVKLDPSHWAERKSLVFMEANVAVVSLSVLQEPPSDSRATDSTPSTSLPNDHLITDS